MPVIAVFTNQFHAVRHRRQRIDQRAELLAPISHEAPPASLRQGQFQLVDTAFNWIATSSRWYQLRSLPPVGLSELEHTGDKIAGATAGLARRPPPAFAR
jgi:hypothetical protein